MLMSMAGEHGKRESMESVGSFQCFQAGSEAQRKRFVDRCRSWLQDHDKRELGTRGEEGRHDQTGRLLFLSHRRSLISLLLRKSRLSERKGEEAREGRRKRVELAGSRSDARLLSRDYLAG